MKELIEEAGYKHVGILQFDRIRHSKMKKKLTTKYLRRVGKVLEAKLEGHMGNISSEVLCSIRRLELCRIGTAILKN